MKSRWWPNGRKYDEAKILTICTTSPEANDAAMASNEDDRIKFGLRKRNERNGTWIATIHWRENGWLAVIEYVKNIENKSKLPRLTGSRRNFRLGGRPPFSSFLDGWMSLLSDVDKEMIGTKSALSSLHARCVDILILSTAKTISSITTGNVDGAAIRPAWHITL